MCCHVSSQSREGKQLESWSPDYEGNYVCIMWLLNNFPLLPTSFPAPHPPREGKLSTKTVSPGFLRLKNIFPWFHWVNKAEFQVNKSQTNQKTQVTLLYVIYIENKTKYHLQYFFTENFNFIRCQGDATEINMKWRGQNASIWMTGYLN